MSQLEGSLFDLTSVAHAPGKFVCANCFCDDALKDVVRANVKSKTCSYCGKRSTKVVAAPLDEVAEHILACFQKRYEDAANGVGWEGEFVGAETIDTWDLIESEVEYGDEASDELHSDLASALPHQIWSRIDPYGPLERDVMTWNWRKFCETVKHVRRYFFQDHLSPTDPRSEKVSPAELLASVAAGCREYGLVRTLGPGLRLFRCRSREKSQKFTAPLDLGPPPSSAASQSRMSPAGIPMFYAAFDAATAVAETLAAPGRHALAEFRTTRPTRVLDLTAPPYVSIFDPDFGHLDEWAAFMRSLIKDFQRPVSGGGEQHYEYVPTQIVTEYFRSGLGSTGRLDGITYRSVKGIGGRCIVLFADRGDVDPARDPSRLPVGPHLLKMRKVTNKRR